jgi:exonuclease III
MRFRIRKCLLGVTMVAKMWI